MQAKEMREHLEICEVSPVCALQMSMKGWIWEKHVSRLGKNDGLMRRW